MKRGRPPSLPIESPDWIPYHAALKDVTDRCGARPLAIVKLDAALEAGAIRCKIERIGTKPELPRRRQVDVVFLPDELLEGGQEQPLIHVNGEPREGWLFLWKFDLIKYFGVPAEPTPQREETADNIGRPAARAWEEIRAEIVRNCWRKGRLTVPKSQQGLALDLIVWADEKWKKPHALSQMRDLVRHTIATLKLVSR